MARVREGDFSNMGQLFERHHKSLFGFFYHMNGDAGKSEDLVQNVFLRMLKYRKSYAGNGSFVAWMYTVARNVSHDSYRGNNPLREATDISDQKEMATMDVNVEESIYRSEQSELLQQAMMKLDVEKREAIVLSKYQGLKYQQIAEMANVSENAIKARVRRGLMDLRQMLEVEN